MVTSIRIAGAALVAVLACASTPSFAGGSADTFDKVVDERGAPVTDFRGNCVRTKWEASNGGCAAASDLSTEDRTIYFDFDQSALNADALNKLDALAATALSDGTVLSAKIVGFADNMGEDSYNMALSKKRAAAVRDYLTGKGLSSEVVKARAVGERASKTECTGSRDEQIACLWQDRKVEVELEFEAK